ncbi:hypothetical protein [Bacillus sp. REN3]|uniref:hypothetical protein n=1 Tax=Bacillus sp. REN3 TaxID=2802440 RepID=UPI001AEDA156|nr:hypothetical protein [Bacillus sp. REN3]
MKQPTIEKIIDKVTEDIFRDDPALLEKYGERGKQKCREDNEHHLRHLATAHSLREGGSFIDYAHWLNGILTARGMKTEHLIENFERLKVAFETQDIEEDLSLYREYLNRAIESLKKDE